MDKTIWINAAYEPVGTEKHTDFEACFSVKDLAGDVPRFTKINYTAFTPDGQKVTGQATGFLARLIQHEIDHTNGVLFIDYLKEDEIISIEEYRARRKAAVEKGR